jgi:putative transposase
MMFVEDIDFRVWAKGMLGKHTLDAGFGEFLNIVQWVCWKRGVYFAKVNKDIPISLNTATLSCKS